MSDTPKEKLNTSKQNEKNNSLGNENLGLGDESNITSEIDDLSEEVSTLSKPTKAPYIDKESTIFTTDRNYNSKTVVIDSGKKRITRVIVSVVVVLALVGSIFAITRFIPKDASETSSGDTSSSSVFSIPVIAADAESVESVSVKNSVDSFDLYSRNVETVASSSTSETSSEVTTSKAWFVTGLDENVVNSSLISSYVNKCISLTAFKLMEDKSLDYGLDTPTTVITVKCKSDYEYSYTISIGDKTPDSSGNYVRIEVTSDATDDISSKINTTVPGDGNIYIVTSSNLSSYEVGTISFANTKMVAAIEQTDANASYFTDSKLSSFDYITLSGTQDESEIRIEPNPDTESVIPFKVTKPVVRYADDQKLADYLTLFSSGLSASSVVSYSQTAEELAQYGFNNPMAVITMKVGEKTEKLIVGSEKDGYYYVTVAGKSPIYMVATTSMAYVSLSSSEYYSSFLFLDNIVTVSSMQFTSDGQDITFDLVSTKDEDDNDVLTVSYDGTTVSTDSMRDLYQYVLGLEPQEYLNEGVEGTNVLTITIKYSNGNSNKVIKFTTAEDSSRQLMATVDGIAQGLVSNSSVTDVIGYVKEVALGNEIASPN